MEIPAERRAAQEMVQEALERLRHAHAAMAAAIQMIEYAQVDTPPEAAEESAVIDGDRG